MTQLTEDLTCFITTRLTETDYSRLIRIAAKVQAPKTVLVREAVLSYLSKFPKEKSASA
ncbi:MAG: hypothetical protein ACYT04_59905 [Nostoc sp.]